MRFELRNYQREAAGGVLNRLDRALDGWAEHRDRSSFALSALTGSGKTVIAAAVIEALLHGSADLDCDADPEISFLWVTDDPALNRQTRNKMLQASEALLPGQLVELDNDFLDSELNPNRVYFLNIQKLSKNAGLASGGNNLRQYSMWEILDRTIADSSKKLVLVLDEAHRGIRAARDRATIVRRIIDGQTGVNAPVPIVWGISATIERFDRAMKDVAGDRVAYPNVVVDGDKVRDSGLIKDQISVEQPDEKAVAHDTLLREAVKATLEFERRWHEYSAREREPSVTPALVVQVPDKVTDEQLGTTITTITSEWPSLAPDAVAHVFGEHETMFVDGREVRWVPPEAIQDLNTVRVVLAKTAISTGWDCPRAEVLFSQRPANDATHIAQIVGRMVRTPLARRITTDDFLNSVSCFLPHFNTAALEAVKAHLQGEDEPQVPVAETALLGRNPNTPAEAFEAVEAIQSLPAPDVLANPLRRANLLATLLTDTAAGDALVPGAGADLRKALNKCLDGFAAQHDEEVAAAREDLETLEVKRTLVGPHGSDKGFTTDSIATHRDDLNRETTRVLRSVKEGVAKDYLQYRVETVGEDADIHDLSVGVASLFRVGGAVEAVENRATEWVQAHLTEHAVAIKNTTGATRDAYRRVQEQTRQPEPVAVELRDNEVAVVKEADGSKVPMFKGHLFADDRGKYPARLNDLETQIIKNEVDRDSFVAWYRNPSRPVPSAVRIAYENEAGKWTSLQVDFVVVSQRDDGSLGVSLIDPHGDYLADTKAKLNALADYADQFGDSFVRVEAISEIDGEPRMLDLLDADVRAAIRESTAGQMTALYQSDLAEDYQ